MFDQATADQVCDHIAQGKSLRQLDKVIGVSPQRVLRQCSADRKFAEQYARAVAMRAELNADRLNDIVNDILDGKITPEAGRAAADQIKWHASKLLPKVYGDRLEIDVVSINITDAIERRQAQLLEQSVPLLPAP